MLSLILGSIFSVLFLTTNTAKAENCSELESSINLKLSSLETTIRPYLSFEKKIENKNDAEARHGLVLITGNDLYTNLSNFIAKDCGKDKFETLKAKYIQLASQFNQAYESFWNVYYTKDTLKTAGLSYSQQSTADCAAKISEINAKLSQMEPFVASAENLMADWNSISDDPTKRKAASDSVDSTTKYWNEAIEMIKALPEECKKGSNYENMIKKKNELGQRIIAMRQKIGDSALSTTMLTYETLSNIVGDADSYECPCSKDDSTWLKPWTQLEKLLPSFAKITCQIICYIGKLALDIAAWLLNFIPVAPL